MLLAAAMAVALFVIVVVVREQTGMAQTHPGAMRVDPPAINNVDPVSGKKVGPYCPTTTYKGQTIGFCCEVSKSEGWGRMSEEEKDVFVARFIAEGAGGDHPDPVEGH